MIDEDAPAGWITVVALIAIGGSILIFGFVLGAILSFIRWLL